MTKRLPAVGFIAALLLLVAQGADAQEAADSLAHPIRTACGVNLDPVGFISARADALGLDEAQKRTLQALGETLAEENRPLGRRFWALAGNTRAMEERAAILFELRMNYRAALDEMKRVLTADQWAAGFEPADADERIRCLSRAIPVAIGSR